MYLVFMTIHVSIKVYATSCQDVKHYSLLYSEFGKRKVTETQIHSKVGGKKRN